MENEEGQECIQGKFDEKKWDIEDRRGQTGVQETQREGPVDATLGR